MTPKPDVLIVGAGVIGMSSAFLLAKYGLSVTVLERGEPGRESSWAGAGIIPPGNYSEAKHPLDELRALSSAYFPGWAVELENETGINIGHHFCGGLELFDKEPTELIRLWVNESLEFEQWSNVDCSVNCPSLRSARFNYFFSDMAQVRNPWYLRALHAAALKFGVKVVPNQEAVYFETHGENRIHSVCCEDDTKYIAGQYLFCPGAWGGQLLERLHVQLPVRPVRGQIILYQIPPDLLTPVVCIGHNYFVPRGDGKLLVGATEDATAGFDKECRASDVDSLRHFAVENIPALATAKVEKTWAGLRPGSPGGIPFIGPIPNFDNAFFAGGHYRAGIQLSPATAWAVMQLMTGQPPSVDLSPFRLDRPPADPPPRPFQS